MAVLLARGLPERALLPAVAMIVFALGAATLDRNRDYASEVALWEATARTSPAKARVFNNLGYAREQAGDRDGARSAYLRSLELDPEFYKAQINLYELERE
jgi:Flp pilus assembly protein TadD